MPNSVSKGFDTATKTGSSRRFNSNDTPQPIGDCQVDFPLLWIKDYPNPQWEVNLTLTYRL